MSHVHGLQHGHGNHHAYGHDKGPQAKGKSGEKAAPAQAPETQAAQQPLSIDSALKALDNAIASLVANYSKDSYNGQAAPEGVTPAASTVANPLQNVAGASNFAPTEPAPLADPVLNLKGGGALQGGVTSDYLRTSGGGALQGGVTSDYLSTRGGGALPGGVTSDRF